VRLLHVDSARGWRGGQNQVLLTLLGMRERGHQAFLACQRNGALEARARGADLQVEPLRFSGDLSPWAVLGLRRAMRRIRPDVVQLHDPHAVTAGVLAAGGLSPLVATRRVDFPLRSGLSRMKYARCRRVIAVSRAIAGVLEKDGLPSMRLRLVHEGVPDRQPLPGGRAALRDLGIPESALVVGTVAALTDHKDYPTLIEAAARVTARVPEAHFVALGEGSMRADLERLVAARGLGRAWTFAGFRDDVDRLLPVFTVFCLSSHMEGLGTSVLDAMAFSRPIVATAAGGIPDAVEDGSSGLLVPPRDVPGLAASIETLLTNPDRRARLGEAARARFLERFTADRMVERTLSVLSEVAANPS
jgi:glycosyltransferase involved in cell wall biosynthesis